MADGKVIQGLLGCSRYIEDDCYISAYDANTGELAWRFNAIAESDQPGGDTWGGIEDLFRAGRNWITGTYDPELKLTYWGTTVEAVDAAAAHCPSMMRVCLPTRRLR